MVGKRTFERFKKFGADGVNRQRGGGEKNKMITLVDQLLLFYLLETTGPSMCVATKVVVEKAKGKSS